MKIIAGVMAVCVMGFGVPYVNAVAENNFVITASAEEETDYTEGTYKQLTYKNYGDYIEISGCDESAIDVVIPAEIEGLPVTSIGNKAFYKCESLTSVNIPDSVTSIGNSAFSECYSLTSIKIPNSVTSIGYSAFEICISSTSIEIPNSITSIEYHTFGLCSSLKSIEIPDSVTSIGFNAFALCSELTSITILNPKCDIFDYNSTISNRSDDKGFYFDGTIYGYENSTAQAYAEKHDYKFVALGKAPEKETGSGDMNGDNSVNVADAVLLQSVILGRQELTEEQYKNADLTGDGFVDSFDMVLLRQKIIENNK